MSRSERTPPRHQITGAHRAVPRVHRQRTQDTLPGCPPAHYEPHLDGLFTYCLSVLCEHDAAIAALGDTLAVAERSRGRLRDPALHRPWLYALARWACLRRFAEGHPAAGAPRTGGRDAAVRRRELASLAWPEAAGTTPEQREAIELAVRHRLADTEIAAVLGVPQETARSLVSRAACEVERTRTALAVVELGGCPAVARLAGDTQVLLGTALRRELVRHVDECPACRLTAERAGAAGPWPGTATPAVLAVVEVARPAAFAAMAHSLRAIRIGARDHRGDGRLTAPRLDRRGFPLDDKGRAARRARLRHRAVTGTVVAAVVAAPALALWAAYHHAPPADGTQGGSPVSVTAVDGGSYAYGGNGRGRAVRPGRGPAAPGGAGPSPSSATSADGSAPVVEPGAAPPAATRVPAGGPTSPAPGWIAVAARPQGTGTVVTVTDEGGSDVRWTASTSAFWLQLSASSGELQPGRSTAIDVAVDQAAEPAGHWRARIVLDPSGTVVTVEGQGATPTPTAPPTPDPSPSPTAP